jgi:outer membrane lipoprotein SlyB
VAIKLIIGAVVGAGVGWVLSLLVGPAVGQTCAVLCVPYRSAIAGALIGPAIVGLVAWGRKKEAPAQTGTGG